MKTHKHKKKRIIAKRLAFSNLFKQKTVFLILPLLFFFILSKSLFAQDNCGDAVEVEADTVCNMESYEFSTSEYWLYFEVGSTSNYQISAHELKGNITAMYVYSGDCRNLNLLDSISNSAYVWYISTLDSLTDGTYYIKIETDTDEGEFELCVNSNPDGNNPVVNLNYYYVTDSCQYENICIVNDQYLQSGTQPTPQFYETNWYFYGMCPDYTNTTYTTRDTVCFQMDSAGTFMVKVCMVWWNEDNYGDTVYFQLCDSIYYDVQGMPYIDFDMSLNTGSNFLGCSNDTCYFDCSTTEILLVDTSQYIITNPMNPPIYWEIDSVGYWDNLGDGVYVEAGNRNPGNVFSWNYNLNPGTYIVHLTGFNDCGADTLTKYIVIEEPYALFTHDTVCLGELTHFGDSSACAYNWHWNFGDGNTDTVQHPTHQYSSPGTYYVTLYINDSTYSYSDSVRVWDEPLVPYTIGYFIYCDSLHWDTILQTTPHCYYVWSYDVVNWNDTIWTNPFVINMPYGDTLIYIMAVDSITGCKSEPFAHIISPCCGEEYLFWDNITITTDTLLQYDTLAINGTIIIEDCEVRLGNMMVYLNSHAKIEVIGTGSLYLEHDSLMICPGMDYMWDGIYVMGDSALVHGGATYIRDAKNAMVIKNCGNYHLETFYFDNNYKAMWIDSCNTSIIDSLHAVHRTHFICTDPAEMLLPYYNQRSYVGIQINEVDSIQIGGDGVYLQSAPYSQRNYFENLDYGIYNSNSNLFVFNNAFKNIDQNNPNPPSPYIGVGIQSTASAEKDLVIGKSNTSGTPFNNIWSNTFENCWEGVYASWNQNVIIKNDTVFSGIDYGFYIRNIDSKTLYVDSNVIDSVKYGVFVYNNQGFGTNKYVSNNIITGCDYGVYVTSNDKVFSIRVANNGIIGGYYPVSILNTRRGRVLDNYIEFDYSSVPAGYTPMGIYAGNSRYSTITDNDIYYTGSSGWKPMGIYADLSPNAYIECNRMYSQYDGIVCVGNMPNSTLKLNLMYGCTYGMYMNSATIGDQLSDSTQTDNRWVNTSSYKMSGNFSAMTNWWYTTNASSEYSPIPYSLSLTNITTHTTSILPSSCSGGGATTSMGGGSLSSIISKDYVYMDNIAENEYYEDTYKYDLIKDNYSLISPSNNAITSYYNSLLNTNIDKFSQVKSFISNKQYANATTILNSINATNSIEKSMIEVYEIQIAQGKADRVDLTNTEYNSLLNVSVLSTIEYGYGVFEACGMLGIHPYVEINVDPKTKSMMKDNVEDVARIYPNPANTTATIEYQFDNGQGGELILYSIEGKQVMKYLLYAQQNEKQIDISSIEEGIYIYSVYTSRGDLVNQGKLVILR